MTNSLEPTLQMLVDTLASNQSTRAIGLSGGRRPFPEPGEGDIDIFVYCTEIPATDERLAMWSPPKDGIEHVEIRKLEGGHWGQGDCLLMAGIETWLLFFTVAEARAEVDAILSGQFLDRLDGYYYPIGRCAMWKTMRVLYDPDSMLQSIKDMVTDYPPELARAVVDHHLTALEDVEDIERAVQRGDVLFFHFVLDLALDHYLQTLFALNNEYFPSRKRSEDYIRDFTLKPLQCERRLRQVVELGSKSETLKSSYHLWKSLVHDLKSIIPPQKSVELPDSLEV